MRKVIHKYEIPPPDPTTKLSVVELPLIYELLHVGAQGTKLWLWAAVEVRQMDIASVSFKVVGTGEAFISSSWQHLGTALMDGGSLVWHVFRER